MGALEALGEYTNFYIGGQLDGMPAGHSLVIYPKELEVVYSPNATMEPQEGFEPPFSIQLPCSPFVAEGVTAAIIWYPRRDSNSHNFRT